MKTLTNSQNGPRKARSVYSLPLKGLVLSAFLLAGTQGSLLAQEDTYSKPYWHFGAAGGANLNFYRGSTQKLNDSFTPPTRFQDGFGAGLYLAPTIEYHNTDSSRWGVILQAGYDNRSGNWDQVKTPCNCPADLETDLSYITIEPSLRFAPFKGNLYLYGGPRLAFPITNGFTYKQQANPDVAGQVAPDDVKGDFSKIESMIFSAQIGAGWDIPISSNHSPTQWVVSPFVAYHPYFGQAPRSIETWDVNTLRVGLNVTFGRGTLIPVPVEPAKIVELDVKFSVNSPTNVPTERRVRETFPIRNYIFFNDGSTVIPDRYVLITKDQVKDFKEDQLEVFTPKRLEGRSGRQMTAYYNVLNIVGDRMGKNPNANIRLTGASMEGTDDGLAMAENVKKYLVDVFGINSSRIATEGRIKPRIPSEREGGTKELTLLREGDRRVSIASSSPEMLMEFTSGNEGPLKPVAIDVVQEAPVDSYVAFHNAGSKEALNSWTLEIRDENGTLQTFGPFTDEDVTIPGKSILGTRPQGDFVVTMVGQAKNGTVIRKDAKVHMNLWVQPKREQGRRYSVIFEINESKSIEIYEKYLTEVVTPKIPANATLIIHGHTDIIGSDESNRVLSLARANEVKAILERAIAKAGIPGVKMEVFGYGEDVVLSPFENEFPEERFYNRTVLIDIVYPK